MLEFSLIDNLVIIGCATKQLYAGTADLASLPDDASQIFSYSTTNKTLTAQAS